MLNLDTHILVYALQDALTKREARLLSHDRWSISAIVLWELTKLHQLNRIELDVASPEFSRSLSRIQIWPVDLAVCLELRTLDFRSDPADEIIAATSISRNVPLVTRDKKLLASKRVPLA